MQNADNLKPEFYRLEQILPDGQVVNREWLQQKGFERTAIDYYVRSGKLERVGRGVYRRPGPPLKWEHLLYSLQELGYTLHVGGQGALDLQGFSHYLSLGNVKKVITLYGKTKVPTWLIKLNSDVSFVSYGQKGFTALPVYSLKTIAFGHWDWELNISTVELALFEFLGQVKDESGFSMADKYFESAMTIRPKLINELLQSCTNIQTKRLFMWFADRHNHQWLSAIDQDKVNLGSGKRAIIKGGSLDTKYNITVPREMTHDDPFFF